MTAIVSHNVSDLIDQWLEQERDGEQFPVPLHDFWSIAGHSKKQDALALVESLLEEGCDYLRSSVKNGGKGRPVKAYLLTCDALKHWAMGSKTEEGRQIRQYFIEAEKKWKLVEANFPQVANEVEVMNLKIELAKLEAQKEASIAQSKQADLALTQFRYTVTQTCPEPIQQKVLGYQTVKEIEVIERVIDKSTGEVSDGVGITYLAKSLGFKSNAQCWGWLERVGYGKDSGKWQDQLIAQYSPKLSREDFYYLKSILAGSPARQMFLGE